MNLFFFRISRDIQNHIRKKSMPPINLQRLSVELNDTGSHQTATPTENEKRFERNVNFESSLWRQSRNCNMISQIGD
jgi:hypothetical protein